MCLYPKKNPDIYELKKTDATGKGFDSKNMKISNEFLEQTKQKLI